eukprot:TRINITY_DN5657_c0_g1_i19.p1 TRINITY_DN5657_c0_g1~~TRINITY_DN5657_c0_g1_i19.p1  ORF type:complete len:272 (-),score=31.52 TRINITY_DN5657_c0_g1_i19:154-969(-)
MRLTLDESAQLFTLLDKKNDGFLDLDELCYIFEERFVFSRDGQKKLYGKNKDIENPHAWTNNPNLKLLPSSLGAPPFLETLSSDMNKETLISPEQERYRQDNVVIMKTPLGAPKRRNVNLPSDFDPSFAYGIKSKPTDNIFDVLNNNYGKEWLMNSIQSEERKREDRRNSRQRKTDTEANQIRRDHISQMIQQMEMKTDSGFWKMKRFAKTPPRIYQVGDVSSRLGDGSDKSERKNIRGRKYSISNRVTIESNESLPLSKAKPDMLNVTIA